MSSVTGPRRLSLFVGALVALTAALWISAHAYAGSRIPRGTTVVGVSIGGLDRNAAAAKLTTSLRSRSRQPFSVQVGGTAHSVSPSAAGLSLDVAATAAAAGARSSWSPSRLLHALIGGSDVAPVVKIDAAKLDAAVQRLATDTDTRVREGAVDFTSGTAVAMAPQPGTSLDRTDARRVLVASFLRSGRHDVRVATTQPSVPASAVDAAMTGFAAAATSGPIVLGVGPKQLEVQPAEVLPFVTMTAAAGALTPKVDAPGLLKALAPRLSEFGTPAVDATVKISGGKPVVVAGKPGIGLSPEGLSEGVVRALGDPAHRTAAVTVSEQAPTVTTEQIRALGVTEVVSEFTTKYPYAPYRVTNIGQAARKINGTLLLPGETFSLNKLVGERTAANGFAEGTIIKDGRFFKDFGGGVSQVATTTFNAMFFAGLKNVEHKPHSFFISRYPVGREATVVWPVVDLKFTNDTKYGVLIQTIHDPGHSLTVRMWSTEHRTVTTSTSARYKVHNGGVVYDTSTTCLHQDAVPGFQVDVTRDIAEGGKRISHEVFHTVYNAADEVHCSPAPVATPRPTPSPTASTVPVAPAD